MARSVYMFLFGTLLIANSVNADSGPKREKALHFEDNTVEGMNRNPLDSLQHLAKKRAKRKQNRLYVLREDLKHLHARVKNQESAIWHVSKR